MGNRIRELRLAQNMTQKELAEIIGCSPPYLYDLELGHRGAKPETWLKIAKALKVTVQDLKKDSDEAQE